jgi:hypothetical protein
LAVIAWFPIESVEVVACAWSAPGLPSGTFEAIGVAPSRNVTAPQVIGFPVPCWVTVAVKVTD